MMDGNFHHILPPTVFKKNWQIPKIFLIGLCFFSQEKLFTIIFV